MDKTGFFRLFAVTLEYCGNRLGITLGPERPTFCPILAVFMTGMVAFLILMFKNGQNLRYVEANFYQICVGKTLK